MDRLTSQGCRKLLLLLLLVLPLLRLSAPFAAEGNASAKPRDSASATRLTPCTREKQMDRLRSNGRFGTSARHSATWEY